MAQPIDTAPLDRNILAFMWGAWRIARWDNDVFSKRPRPFWRADGLLRSDSRFYAPQWWAELPPTPERTP